MGCIRNRRDNQKQDQFSHEQIQGEGATESYAAVQRTQQLLPNASSNAQTRQIRGAVARFVLILLMLAAGGSTLKLYIVLELIAGLFFVAVTVTTIFALTVAFVLCQEAYSTPFSGRRTLVLLLADSCHTRMALKIQWHPVPR
jgi:hypothetical protein